MKKTVSLIIPMYNVEKYIEQCLDSVLRQTYTDYEVILIDDGSTDRTVELVQPYVTDNDNFLLLQQSNGGASVARNKGLDYASGEYIYFFDSDDYMMDDALERLVSEIKKQRADIVKFSAYTFSDDDLSLKWGTDGYKLKGDYSEVYSGPEFLHLTTLNDDAYLVNCGHLFIRRSIIEDSHLRFFEGIIHEDVLFHWQVLMLASRVSTYNYPLSCRRYRSGSVMARGNWIKRIVAMNTIVSETDEFLKKVRDYSQEDVDWFLRVYSINILQFWLEMSKEERNSSEGKLAINIARIHMKKHHYCGKLNIRLFSINPNLYGVYHGINQKLRK